jgi:hypothetical protein
MGFGVFNCNDTSVQLQHNCNRYLNDISVNAIANTFIISNCNTLQLQRNCVAITTTPQYNCNTIATHLHDTSVYAIATTYNCNAIATYISMTTVSMQMGSEAGMLGCYWFRGVVFAGDGSDHRGRMGAGAFCLGDVEMKQCVGVGREEEGTSSNKPELAALVLALRATKKDSNLPGIFLYLPAAHSTHGPASGPVDPA